MLCYKALVVALAAGAPVFGLPAVRTIPAALASRNSPNLISKNQDATYAVRDGVNEWHGGVSVYPECVASVAS